MRANSFGIQRRLSISCTLKPDPLRKVVRIFDKLELEKFYPAIKTENLPYGEINLVSGYP